MVFFKVRPCRSTCQYILPCFVWLCLSIPQLIGTWLVSTLGLLRIVLHGHSCVILYEYMFQFSWNIPRGRIARSYGNSVFNVLRTCQDCFPKWLHHFIPGQRRRRVPVSLHPYQRWLFSLFQSISGGREVVSSCGFDLHFPLQSVFMALIWPRLSPLL